MKETMKEIPPWQLLTLAIVTPEWAPMADAWAREVRALGVGFALERAPEMQPEPLWVKRLKTVLMWLETMEGPILMSDVDTRWFADPRPAVLAALQEGADIVAMKGLPPSWQPWTARGWTACCGFMAWANNERVRDFLGAVIGKLEVDPHARDQHAINALADNELWRNKIRLQALPGETFARSPVKPAGCVVWHPLVRERELSKRMAALGWRQDDGQ